MTPDTNIPEWIPTWVTPAPTPVVSSVSPAQATTPSSASGEGLLDRAVKSLARFFARLGGLPDPITGKPMVAPNTEAPLQKAANFADKVWSTANKVADKAASVTTQAVEKTKTTVNQAVEWVKDVQADIAATSQPNTPESTQSLEALEKNQ